MWGFVVVVLLWFTDFVLFLYDCLLAFVFFFTEGHNRDERGIWGDWEVNGIGAHEV